MSIDLRWEDEDGRTLGHVEDDQDVLARSLAAADVSGTACLRFVDPFGDTIFNQLQIPTLLAELTGLHERLGPRSGLQGFLDLARRSRGQVHTYLRFCGD